jgi:hypothetical protein
VYFVRLRLANNINTNDNLFGKRVSNVISGIRTKYSTFTNEYTNKGKNSKNVKQEDFSFKNPMFDETVKFLIFPFFYFK